MVRGETPSSYRPSASISPPPAVCSHPPAGRQRYWEERERTVAALVLIHGIQLVFLCASRSIHMSANPPPPPPGSSAPAGASYFPLPFHLQQQQQPQMPMAATSYQQYQQQMQQAHQLFQRDAQTITPEALQSVKAALATSDVLDPTANARPSDPSTTKKPVPRRAAGQTWEDPTLTDWPENDYRLFCGDLGNEVNDDVLSKAFSRFPSFNMARVVRDKRTGKTKGYGFVSFSNPTDLAAAIKEMNGKYVGNRPIKLRKSNWKERTDVEALERQKSHIQRKPKMPKKSILHK